MHTLFLGDCRDAMATLEDASVDAIVCDPPYGLSKEPNVIEVLTHWLAGDDYVHSGGGFMGKTWDSFVPGPATWREAFRVLKPGGYLLAFAGSRTVDLMGIAIRMAGFEMRDCLSWMYGSGFPKSMDVSKAIDKAAGAERAKVAVGNPVKRIIPGADQNKTGSWIKDNGREYQPGVEIPATDEAAEWEGWGTALKPAYEPIVMARKPFKGTVANNVLIHGTGALNIDATRVAANGDNLGGGAETKTSKDQKGNEGWTRPWMEDPEAQEAHAARVRANVEKAEVKGRWPANVLLSHHEDCVQTGMKDVPGSGPPRSSPKPENRTKDLREGYGTGKGFSNTPTVHGFSNDDGTETVEAWECVEDCPVRLLDEQTGQKGGGDKRARGKASDSGFFAPGEDALRDTNHGGPVYADQGGASRFFYCAKTPKKERNAGLPDGHVNDHPTVKPVEAMRWLVRMVTPPGGVVLDPFMGSGTTGIAAAREGFDFMGMELDPHFVAISAYRIGAEGVQIMGEVVEPEIAGDYDLVVAPEPEPVEEAVPEPVPDPEPEPMPPPGPVVSEASTLSPEHEAEIERLLASREALITVPESEPEPAFVMRNFD